MTENNAAQPGLTDDEIEAVRRALEIYAECYDTMTRIAAREGREPVASPVSVAFDIRKNMVNAVVNALSKLRAEGVQAGGTLPPMPATQDRQPSHIEGYVDSDNDWCGDNPEAVTWLADYHAEIRAALASAPVADKGCPHIDEPRSCWRVRCQLGKKCVEPVTDTSAASAPVAGEAIYQIRRLGSEDWKDVSQAKYEHERKNSIRGVGKRWQRRIVYAAPQASEAVGDVANKSARAIAFDDWLAKHCDSDDLTAYERELALDAWNAARSSPQASAESIDLAGIDADRLRAIAASGSHTAISNALLNIARALKTQADKDGAVCSCPTGDGSLRHPCAVHPPAPRDCAKGSGDGQQKYWLCCGSTEPEHRNRRAPDCFNADRAKWGTADQHSAAQKQGDSE
ncbi:hypothetical protein D3C87_519140 [compost metagenome]